MPRHLAKAKSKSGRAAKNGSARPAKKGNGLHRVDLGAEELEVLLKACQKYRASLPCYLASAQEDLVRAQALIERLGDFIEEPAD